MADVKIIEPTGTRAKDRDGLFRHRGIWHFKLKIAGKWRQFSTKSENYNQARNIRHEFIKQQIEGRLPSDMARWQLPKALEKWRSLRAHTLSPRSLRIAGHAGGHLEAILGTITLGSITADIIADYQQSRLANGAAPKTVNLEVGELRGLMKRARLWANVQPDVRMLREPQSPGVALRPEREANLLAACAESRSPALYPFVVLAIETGARRGTLLGLQWKRVDLGNRCLTWGKDKTPAGTGRIVPLSGRAMQALMAWAEQFPNRQPGDYVFPYMRVGGGGQRGPQGSRQQAAFASGVAYDVDPAQPMGSIKSAWETARKRAGLNLRIHDLRHTAASRMLDAGIPLAKIARILGWRPSTATLMAHRYGHFSLDDLRSAVETISAPRRAVDQHARVQ